MKTTLALVLVGHAMAASAQADELVRLATAPRGATVAGLFLQGPDLFLNLEHPGKGSDAAFAKATVGAFADADFSASPQPPADDETGRKVLASTLGRYQILMRAGDGAAGRVTVVAGDELLVSKNPAANGFVASGPDAGQIFTVWDDRPGGISRAGLTRGDNGGWTVGAVSMLDLGAAGGIWSPAFATVSPWGTPLIAEDLDFDTTVAWNDPDFADIENVQRLAAYLSDGTYPNPYRYGHIVELANPAGNVAPVRLLALGRLSHAGAAVMPDNRTVYLSDGGDGAVFFKFVADNPGDLRAGTLFAARVTQDAPAGSDPANAGFAIDWIPLAHGDNDAIGDWVADYDGIGIDSFVPGRTNYMTEAEVAAWAKGEAADDRAAFLESRRAAVAMGATGEFSGMAGLGLNFAGATDGSVPFLFLAVSEVASTMADGAGAIDLAANRCGIVYEMRLHAAFNVTTMVPLVAGHGYDAGNAPDACPVDSIANPASLVVRADGDAVIGEAGQNHENNALWLYRKNSPR